MALEGRSARDAFEKLFAERGFVFRAFAEPAFDAARLSLNVFNSAAEIDAFVEALS